MYLKALEIQGFKSFPDKTVLTFGSDITGIVGPNGSGKSNISDAIRWVMGEMSTKALRGGKMEDVIFGGTIKRPQVGYAEVSLVIDNTANIFPLETPEVMVTRRYFRSGDSEYYINKQSARLKDIVELFMDTGLGREGYSQIGQGKIDEIISVKSADRREIFEEAAGISKYRHRKEESERKLKNTQDNLTRINDKIAELELSVEPLREQAAKAKRYLILRDELRSLEVTVWLDNLEKHKVTAAKAVADYETAKLQSEQVQGELNKLYADSDAVSEKMHRCDSDTEQMRTELAAFEAAGAETESAIAVAHTNLDNYQTNLEKLRKDLTDQSDRSGGIMAQLESRRLRIAEIEQEIAQKQQERAEISEKTDALAASAGDLTQRLEALKAQQTDKLEQASHLETEISNLAGSVQMLYDRDGDISRELAGLEEKKNDARKELDSCVKSLKEAEDKTQSLSNTVNGYQLRMKARSDKAESLNQKLMKLTVDRQSLQGRIDMLTEMERDYEGYNKAVRLVMAESEKGRLKNVYAPVSKLVQTDDQYTVAIETALGSSMQSIVVQSEADGKNAIEFLKRRDGGRATFLPVTAIKGNRISESGLENQPGFEGIACDLVRFDKRFEGIFRNLLGRTVIAENLDKAIAIAKKYSHRFRIVTLDGQVLNSGGSMTGGSTSKNSGILSRANELKRLHQQMELLKKDHEDMEQQAAEAKRQAEAVEYELSVAQDELRAAQDEVLKLQGLEGQHRLLCESLEDAEETLRSEAEGIKNKLSENEEKINSLRTQSNSLKAEAEEVQQQYTLLSGDARELEEENNSLADALAAIRAAQAALEAEQSATTGGITELQSLAAAIEGDREQSEQAAMELESQIDTVQKDIVRLTDELEQNHKQTQEFRSKISALIESKLELEGERTRLDRAVQEKNRQLVVVERETARLEQKKATSDLEEKQIVDKLWDNYELTVTTAEQIRLEDMSTSKANRRISEIKKEISSLGTPNIGAIDEFERVNTRYEFLTGQRDDVETAKAELEGIIGDITAQMKVIFVEQFALINESFKTTFTEIFGGGKAELILEDENDVLGCGIEIKVQPPGKQVKTITLLSGGEKAFVAIALYFAILKVSPTPFCVMDEIDAALDDNNVRRFAAYLRKLADKTQFIVITHRRGTMEEADVLYGVTMQEQGVSKMLTLDLDQMSKQMNIN